MLENNGSIFVIAEAGVNHNGDRKLAFDLIDVAAESGSDAIKFQTFKAKDLATADARKAAYQRSSSNPLENQVDMLTRLELDFDFHFELQSYCLSKNIIFMSTAFDHDSLNFLDKVLGVEIIKFPSGEITNGPLLLRAGRSGKKIILSTGMSNLREIEEALGVLAYSTVTDDGLPSRDNFNSSLRSEEGRRLLYERVTLLHCTTCYPAPTESVNLLAMDTLRSAFNLQVGLSDHSAGVHISIAAAARGAQVIEKHFTIDRSLPGPDHYASLEPGELREMVSQVRDIEIALGDGKKFAADCELDNMEVARNSLVAKISIAEGDLFSAKNLAAKRPGNGMSPMEYWSMLGQPASKSYKPDQLIDE